jgi:DNA-binding NarL/FixJ family response regulator
VAVIAIVDDLFFAVKIRETARHVGVTVEVVGAAKGQDAVQAHISARTAEAVIVDLNSAGAIELIGRLKREAPTRSLPLLSFVSHVAADVIAAARTAGCDQVLARSAFTKQLPDLLRSLSQGSGADQGSGTGGQGSGKGTPNFDRHGSPSIGP